MEPSLFDFQYFSFKGSPSISFQKAPLKSNIGAIIDMFSVIWNSPEATYQLQ